MLAEPEFLCGNIPTRECRGPCADYCERFPWKLPNHEPLKPEMWGEMTRYDARQNCISAGTEIHESRNTNDHI